MQVTTTDQETGAVGKEPLMTLGKFRSGKELGWSALASWKHEVCHDTDHICGLLFVALSFNPLEGNTVTRLGRGTHPSCRSRMQAVHAPLS